MTQYLSDKLRILSFFSIVVVLYIHANFPDTEIGQMALPMIARKTIAGVLGPCAVPLFYVMSGYLFFRHIDSVADVLGKLKKRAMTLLVPFVIAAVFYPVLPIAKQVVFHSAPDKDYLLMLQTDAWPVTLRNLFVDCGTGRPWAYHLWFLRDLIVIVALSPVLHLIKKWTGCWVVAIVLVLYLLFPAFSPLYGMFWFVAGSCFLAHMNNLSRRFVMVTFALFLALATFHQFVDYPQWQYVRVVEISFGIVSLWGMYDHIMPSDFQLSSRPVLSLACQYTFFIYLYHEPTFHTIVKAIPALMGKTELGYAVSILLSPLIYLPFGIAVAHLFKRFFPTPYSLLTGSR